jgi:hypothetical protein
MKAVTAIQTYRMAFVPIDNVGPASGFPYQILAHSPWQCRFFRYIGEPFQFLANARSYTSRKPADKEYFCSFLLFHTLFAAKIILKNRKCPNFCAT